MVSEIVKKNASIHGLVIGVLLSLITIAKYSTDYSFFIAWWPTLLSFSIFVFVPVLAIIKTKTQLKKQYFFKDVFTTYFICVLIGLLLSVAAEIILFNIIDPSLKTTLIELTINYLKSTSGKFDVSTKSLNEMINNLKQTDPFSTAEQIKGAVVKLFFLSIVGLIMAALFKSKPQDNE